MRRSSPSTAVNGTVAAVRTYRSRTPSSRFSTRATPASAKTIHARSSSPRPWTAAEWDRTVTRRPYGTRLFLARLRRWPGGRPRQRSPLEALDKLVLVHRHARGGGPAGVHALRGDRPGQGRRDRPRRGTGGACRDHDHGCRRWRIAARGCSSPSTRTGVERWCEQAEVRAHGRRLESAWRAWASARHREQAGFPACPT